MLGHVPEIYRHFFSLSLKLARWLSPPPFAVGVLVLGASNHRVRYPKLKNHPMLDEYFPRALNRLP